jgi:hypothetical protein
MSRLGEIVAAMCLGGLIGWHIAELIKIIYYHRRKR